MAKLPIYTQQYTVSTRRADADDFGAMEGRALQNLGAGLGDLGLKLQAKKEQDDMSKARRDASDLELRLYEEKLRMRQSIREGGEGHSEEFEEYMDSEWENLSRQYSGKAKDYLQESHSKSRLSHMPQELEFEATARVTDLVSKEEDIRDREQNLAYLDPTALPDLIERSRERSASYAVDPRTGYGIPQEQLEEMNRKHERELQINTILGELFRAETVEQVNEITSRLEAMQNGRSAIDTAVDAIIGVESGGRHDAQNPLSSARGTGQFIESTWREMIRKYRPDLIEGRTDEEILALRDNPYISRQMTEGYARENAEVLENANLPVTDLNLYTLHHFGAGGVKVIKASPDTKISSLLSNREMEANPYLKGKTVGQVRQNHRERLAHYGGGEVDAAGKFLPRDFQYAFAASERKIAKIERDNAINASAQVKRIGVATDDYVNHLTYGGLPERPDALSDSAIREAYGRTGDEEDIEAGEELIRDIARYERGSEYASIMTKGTVEEIAAMQDDVASLMDNPILDNRDKRAVQEMVVRAYNKRIKDLEDAPADYVLKHSDLVRENYEKYRNTEDPAERQMALKTYFDSLLQTQRDMGVLDSNLRVLTEPLITYYKDMLVDSRATGEEMYQAVMQMRYETGEYFSNALFDLYAAKAAPVGLSAIAEIPNDRIAQDVAIALKQRSQNIKDFNLTEKDFSTISYLADYNKSLGRNVFRDIGMEFTDTLAATDALSIKYLADGDSDAQKNAYVNVVGSRYEFADVFLINSQMIRVPLTSGIPASRVQDALIGLTNNFGELYSDQIAWEAFSDDLSMERRKEQVISSIEAQAPRFITAPDDSGIVIVTRGNDVVMNNDGGMFVIPWNELADYSVRRAAEARERADNMPQMKEAY